MTVFQDSILDKLRDYVDPEADPLVPYQVQISDLRSILSTMAVGGQWIEGVQNFLGAASVVAALTAIGLGVSGTPTFASATLTELTVATSALVVDEDGQVGVGTASPSYGLHVATEAYFGTTTTLAGATSLTATLAATSGGKIVVGNATTPTVGGLAGAEGLAVTGTGDAASASISRYSNDAVGARLTLLHGRGASVGATTAIQNGDELGSVRFGAPIGVTTPAEGAYIAAVASGVPSTSSLPASLVLATTASGATSATERARFVDGGQFIVGHTAAVAVGPSGSTLTSAVQLHGTTQALASLGLGHWANDNNGSVIRLFKAKSGTIGTHGAVANGTVVSQIGWWGSTGSTWAQAGVMTMSVEGTVSTSEMPGRWSLSLSPTGSATVAEMLSVGPDYFVSFGDRDTGILGGVANTLPIYTGGVEALRVDASQRLLIGTTAAISAYSNTFRIQVAGGGNNAGISVSRWSNDASAANFVLSKSRNVTVGTYASGLIGGDEVGMMSFIGDKSDAPALTAAIRVFADADFSSTSSPGRVSIWTTSVGATTLTERFRVDSAGFISFGDTDTGIQGGIANTLPIYTNGVERWRTDGSGRILVGQTSSTTVGGIAIAGLQMGGTSNAATMILGNYAAGVGGFNIYFAKGRSGTSGTVGGAVSSGDIMGSMVFHADDGSSMLPAAAIYGFVDSSVSTNTMYGRLSFHTNNGSASTTERLRLDSAGVVRPGADNTQTLGSASFRWSTVYAGTGTINTSDARDKEVLPGTISGSLYAAAASIAENFVTYKWKDAINSKGWYKARTHIGVTAQTVQQAFLDAGLDPGDFAIWTNTPLTEKREIDGVEIDVPVYEADGVTRRTRMGLRHDQLSMLLIAAGLQRINSLETRIAALEAA